MKKTKYQLEVPFRPPQTKKTHKSTKLTRNDYREFSQAIERFLIERVERERLLHQRELETLRARTISIGPDFSLTRGNYGNTTSTQ